MSYRMRVLAVTGGAIALLLVYWLSGYVFAYTDDAYVTSDLVAIAPQITGKVIAVHVVDNQNVTRGTPLLSLDPEPFRLEVAQKQAKLDEANAQLSVDRDAVASATALHDAAIAAERLTRATLSRYTSLNASGYMSRENLDQATSQQQTAEANLAATEAAISKAEQVTKLHEAAVATAKAELALAQWHLGQTEIAAPVDGTVNNLTVRVGDEAVANVPLIGIVDAAAWRIFANYKQDVIRHFKAGRTAWVWLDTYPWHFHRAHIQGIASGISRNPMEQQQQQTLLPYVAPTTDWIRLQRRFPVTLVLDNPSPEIVLHMGADARSIIFY